MNTKMPLLQIIQRGGGSACSDLEEANVMIEQIHKNSTYFDIQVACDIAMAKVEKDQVIRTDRTVGSIRPPYNSMWMEWTTSTAGKSAALGSVQSLGCLVTVLDEDSQRHDSGVDASISFDFFILVPKSNEIAYTTIVCLYRHDEHGILEKAWMAPNGGDPFSPEEVDFITHISNHALTALALMNCKNVKIEENGSVGLARSGTEKRRGIPARKIKYHTIMLPGGGSQSDGKGGHRATAIHRVRGHFKTFTAEKPLLGQHVGTYWWGWQVRGKAENGIVVSDYKIGTPK